MQELTLQAQLVRRFVFEILPLDACPSRGSSNCLPVGPHRRRDADMHPLNSTFNSVSKAL